MSPSEAYVWLDVIKAKLVEDVAPDKEIKAIEFAQRMIREEVTGYAEEYEEVEVVKVGSKTI